VGEIWFAWDIGLQKLALWLQTEHIYGYVRPLFGMQNCLVLTSKSTTAAMTTRSETCLQCKPRNFWGHIASQEEDMLRVKENKEQNPKKLGAIRHAVRQTCEVMNASSDAAEFKISLMLRRVARPARQ